jgi:hypothetical protein
MDKRCLYICPANIGGSGFNLIIVEHNLKLVDLLLVASDGLFDNLYEFSTLIFLSENNI